MATSIAFTTKRLNAHYLTRQNQQFVIDLYHKKESAQFLQGLDVMQDIELVLQSYQKNKIGAYLFFCKDTNEFVGFGGVQNQEPLQDGSFAMPDEIEFLIMVDAKHAGLGFANEFSLAFLELFFKNFPQKTIPARVNKENISCLKLLQKIGFKQEGETFYCNRENKFHLLRCEFHNVIPAKAGI